MCFRPANWEQVLVVQQSSIHNCQPLLHLPHHLRHTAVQQGIVNQSWIVALGLYVVQRGNAVFEVGVKATGAPAPQLSGSVGAEGARLCSTPQGTPQGTLSSIERSSRRMGREKGKQAKCSLRACLPIVCHAKRRNDSDLSLPICGDLVHSTA